MGLILAAGAGYSAIATVLWNPARWPVAVFLAGAAVVPLVLGLTRFWLPEEYR